MFRLGRISHPVALTAGDNPMSAITLRSAAIQGWKPTGKAVELWIFSQEAWLTSDGKIKMSGSPDQPGIVLRVPCSEADGTLNISAITIDSTTNAQLPPAVRYLAYLYTVRRNK